MITIKITIFLQYKNLGTVKTNKKKLMVDIVVANNVCVLFQDILMGVSLFCQ